MTEQFVNSIQTELASPISSSDGTLVVVSATGMPATGTFRAAIDTEIVRVDSRIGTTLTVSRGQESSTAAAHLAGASVRLILTAAAMNQFKSDVLGDSTNILASGTNPFTGDQSMGGHQLTNLPTPLTALQAVNKAYVDALAAGLSPKGSVQAIATTNLTLSGTQTIDSYAAGVGDRVAAAGQTTGTQNGLYLVASGAWTRTADLPAGAHAAGAYFFVEEGSRAQQIWFCSTIPPNDVVGTNSLSFLRFSTPLTFRDGLTGTTTVDVNPGNGLDIVGGAASGGALEVSFASSGLTQVTATSSAAAGAANTSARGDHTHSLSTAVQSVTVKSDASTTTTGSAASVLRTDAQLLAVTAAPSSMAAANTQGTSTSLSRADHQHARDVAKQETFTGETVNGTDTILTHALAATPVPASSGGASPSVLLAVGGVIQAQGTGRSYTVNGTAITWLGSTGTGGVIASTDRFVVTYMSQG